MSLDLDHANAGRQLIKDNNDVRSMFSSYRQTTSSGTGCGIGYETRHSITADNLRPLPTEATGQRKILRLTAQQK